MTIADNAASVSAQTYKLIIFSLGKGRATADQPLYLGAPIGLVQKILSQTAIYSSGQTLAGVAHVQEQEVAIIDLHRLIFGTPIPQAAYLVILKSPEGELLGIPVAESPALAEANVAEIRLLPDTYRQGDTLGMASHVTVVTTEEGSRTVFLLDPSQLTALLTRGASLPQQESLI